MARPTAEERRQVYLEVGADLVAGFGVTLEEDRGLDALANVKVADVARRAGVTKGALYHIWESQEDFRRDLFQHLLDLSEEVGTVITNEVITGAEEGLDITDLATRLSSSFYERICDDPRMLARFSFYNYADDPRVNAMLATGVSGFDGYYEQYLRAAGRRMRPPLELRHLITSINSHLFGSVVRHRIAGTGPTESDVALYARGFRAILLRQTEPDV